jgi:hypothetical protein
MHDNSVSAAGTGRNDLLQREIIGRVPILRAFLRRRQQNDPAARSCQVTRDLNEFLWRGNGSTQHGIKAEVRA